MKSIRFSAILISVVSLLLVWWISTSTYWFDPLERGLRDIFIRIRDPGMPLAHPSPDSEILVIGIDEASLSKFGKWPWSRIVTAQFLERIAAYNPRTVLLDFIYSAPESPPFELEQSLDPELRKRIVAWYQKIDGQLADAMKSISQVFVDVALLEQSSAWYGHETMYRLMEQNRSWLQPWSQPSLSPSMLQFKSFEPVIADLITTAKPAPINLYPDPDGVVRYFPLWYTWIPDELESWNIFSVVVNLLRTIYRIESDDIEIQPKQLVLRNATVPLIDRQTGQHLIQRMEIREIEKRVSIESPYEHRGRLLQYFLAEGRWGNIDILLKTPIDIRVLPNGTWELMDGLELLTAARHYHLPSVAVRLYHLQDLSIPTHHPGMLTIHYGGDPVVLQHLPRTTPSDSPKPLLISFKTAWEMEPLPDVIASEDRLEGSPLANLESWFMSYATTSCNNQRADRSDTFVFAESVSLCTYLQFLQEKQIEPGSFRLFYDRFDQWAASKGIRGIEPFQERHLIHFWLECARNRYLTFYGRTVLVGGTAKGLGDLHATPYGIISGISLIANALNTVLQDATIRFSDDIDGLDPLILFGFGLCLTIAYFLIPFRFLPLCFIGITGLIIVLSAAFFHFHHLFIRTMPMLASNFLLSMGMLLLKLITEEKDRKFLHATFRSYLAPEIIDEMFRTKTLPTLGGEERVMTAFFSDIAGFTRISEALEPGRLVTWMNEYFAAMTRILFTEKGTIDKYVGDAIVAFFGAPFWLPDHALRACRTALRMQEYLMELRSKWKQEGCWLPEIEQLHVRIGINSGRMVVGNMGSENRMNYTMMGDEVNLASRLESAGKQYGVHILVSAQTLEIERADDTGKKRLLDEVEVRFIDNVRVKGKQTPVKIYELMGFKGNLSTKARSLKESYDRAMHFFQEHRYDEALTAFEEALTWEIPDTQGICPSQVYINRCRERIAAKAPQTQVVESDEITLLKEK